MAKRIDKRAARLAALLADTNLSAAFAAVRGPLGHTKQVVTITELSRRPGALSLAQSLEIIEAAIRGTGITIGDVLGAVGVKQVAKAKHRAAGKARGRQKTQDAAQRDRRVAELMRHWERCPDVQDEHRTAVAYVVNRMGVSRSTVYKSLARQSHKR